MFESLGVEDISRNTSKALLMVLLFGVPKTHCSRKERKRRQRLKSTEKKLRVKEGICFT